MTTAGLTRETAVSRLQEIFARQGGQAYLGEAVTMAEHMLQAAHLAEQDGEPEAVIVAALLHDIGHFTGALGAFSMDDTEDRRHEVGGAAVLSDLFPPLVVDCVREHVAAKRYLCAVDPGYMDRLSAASQHSLRLQGGPMNEEEVKVFVQHPHLAEIVKVRSYDDRGKEAGAATPPLAHYLPMVRRVMESA